MIGVSWFQTEKQPVPSREVVPDFATLVRRIGPPKPHASKAGVPMYSPAEWPEGANKTKRNVAAVHFGVLDYDDVPEDDLAALLASLRTDYLFVSSWSHGSPPKKAPAPGAGAPDARGQIDRFLSAWRGPERFVRGRLVIPFSRPVAALEWPRVWRALAPAYSRGKAIPDPTCKDASRCFYVPAHPMQPPAAPIHIERLTTGASLDVDELLARVGFGTANDAAKIVAAITDIQDAPPAPAAGGPVPAQFDITRHELRTLQQEYARKRSQSGQEMAHVLRAICDGESFAEYGNHDNMLFRFAATVMRRWPYASPESIAALVAPSLQVMSPGESLDWVLEKLRRRKQEEREVKESVVQSHLLEFFHGQRSTPYSATEIQRFEEQNEARMGHRWIVQRARTYFVFSGKMGADGTCHGGDYDARFSADDLVNASRVLLAPAASVGVKLDVLNDKGFRAKTPAELVRDYGIVAKRHVVDLTAEFSYYDGDTGTFVEAPCPPREIQARFHPEVDQWLRLLGGPRAPMLLEWIAWVTHLGRPASALYLEGPAGTGKTLLACGLARLWTKLGPTALADCLGTAFNDQLLKCPLVFADEVAPKDFQGRVLTGQIREFIQAKQRTLRRKYVDCDTVRGAVRLIFAANNTELLSSNEHLTVNDIAAITERFLHVPVQAEAAEYLRDVRERGQMDSWIDQDLIAEHALYLRDTIPLRDDARLLASGDASSLATSLTIGTGIRSAVLHWLVLYLLDPSRLAQNPANRLLRMNKGRLAVNARIFAEAWSVYPTNTAAPTAGRIAQAVAGLADGARVQLRDRTGGQTWYREIATENLVAWAEDNGYASGEVIREILAHMDRMTTQLGMN